MSSNANNQPLPKQLEERAKEFGTHAFQAVSSFSWLWPFRGVLFAITNPSLIGSVRPALIKSLILSSIIFLALLIFTYLPQMTILVLLTGPLAPLFALILIGAESLLILTFLAKPLFLEPALTQVFDAALVARGQRELVIQGKKRIGGGGSSSKGKDVGKALVRPLQGFTPSGIAKYALSLPLNFIPAVGTAFFILYNGTELEGPGWHSRYFQLKGLSKQQRQSFIESHRPEYTAFGAATLLLNLVPFVGLLFSFTNTIGAALWAADVEAKENLIGSEGESAKNR
ncbi:hypothetical protein OE88DRAFT_1721107 [Heliocybe sulcata]|uniref:Outer spore wall protein RRT8 n=1 Tax=Heliocybe sulcata TaxID=5364 RepID=A0A5C3MRV5_9AGAM|nr:hypothetical protein OE88DRAFT_1721107 [Heliocybe sulcata]